MRGVTTVTNVFAIQEGGESRVSSGKGRRGSNRATTDAWERWQLYASITRIVMAILQPLIDRFTDTGPGRLL
jgi:hypothetical protein